MPQDAVRWTLEMDKRDIAYLCGVFEGYDDLAVVRTLDPARGRVELLIAPDYAADVRRLLAALEGEISLRVLDGS
ncbi:MAG: DUF4911 domain-containing protein [Nitrospinaceae bacterium]